MSDMNSDFLEFAASKRADLVGFAPVERFAEVAPNHHPASIFPECRTVIAVGKRITRGTLRGIEEGTQFDLYGQYGLSWLKDRMLAITTITLATWLEDRAWEACPLQDLPPEVPPSGIAVKPELPPPNVMVDVADAAVRAGLAEYGYCGELLTPQFGPRQRFQLILTDAVFEGTPLLSEPVCDQCGACAASCPLGAFGADARTVTVCGKEMVVGDVDDSRCRSCRNGARANPNHRAGKPDRLGALCIRSCVNHLDATGRIENTLANPFRVRPAWARDARGQVSLVEEADA